MPLAIIDAVQDVNDEHHAYCPELPAITELISLDSYQRAKLGSAIPVSALRFHNTDESDRTDPRRRHGAPAFGGRCESTLTLTVGTGHSRHCGFGHPPMRHLPLDQRAELCVTIRRHRQSWCHCL